MQYTLGADPESFLTLGGKFVSASGLFPGTKYEPFKVDKGAIQVDGLALEFNIDPASTEDEFNGNIEAVLSQMTEMVKEVDKDMKINFVPFARFDKHYFDSVPEEAKVLGCDPDFNVLGFMNTAPDITNQPLRTAAGHIHIGWSSDEDTGDPVHFQDCQFVASFFHKNRFKSYFSARTPLEKRRLSYYGGMGAFRPKSYGVELRSPSNIWVEQEQSRREMFRYSMKMMENIS